MLIATPCASAYLGHSSQSNRDIPPFSSWEKEDSEQWSGLPSTWGGAVLISYFQVAWLEFELEYRWETETQEAAGTLPEVTWLVNGRAD